MNRSIRFLLPVIDLAASPAVYPAGYLLRVIRWIGVGKMPRCRRALMRIGVFPIRNHYYEPLFDGRALLRPLSADRVLPGIDWNIAGQLELLRSFRFAHELEDVSRTRADELTFHMDNGSFESGDAEFLYNLIRLKKPSRLIEIGSGHSTLIASRAIAKNREESPGYRCEHVCIEPYEAPWLERSGVTVIRERVEAVDPALFAALGRGDLLFIDSTHVIRPQGDVLFEYLELLPTLRPGVIVHLHDIFSPRDYPKQWVVDEVRFWNEQYLLEAFLSGNREWRILGALNHLHHHHGALLKEKCPFLTPDREPGSFYMERIA